MAVNAEQLNIILSARDKEFSKAMQNSQKRVERFAKQSQKGLSQTGKAFDGLGSTARKLGTVLAGAMTVRAIKGLTTYAQEIKNMANLAGISVTQMQALGQASKTVGIPMEKLADIYKDMNDRVGDFLQTGGGPMKDFFETIGPAVGVTADDFARLAGPEALQLFVSSLEKANLTSNEMTFYLEAMASDATALLPLLRNNGSEFGRLADEAKNAGRVLDQETINSLVDLNAKLEDASTEMKTNFMVALADVSDELIVLSDFVSEYGAPALQAIITLASEAATALGLMFDGIAYIKRVGDIALGLEVAGDTGATSTPEDMSDLNNEGTSSTGNYLYDKHGNVILDDGTVLETNLPPAAGGKPRTPVRPAPKTKSGGAKTDNTAEKLASEYDRLLGILDPLNNASREFAEQEKTINELMAKGIISRSEGNDLMSAATQQMKDATFASSDLNMIMETVQSSMEDAFMGMVDGTVKVEDAFKSMASDIIKELYRVLVVQQLVGSFKTGGGGILGAIAPSFGRASGGSVMSGQAYTVGEHGREPFIPAQNGRILSTAQAKSAMSGGGGSGVTIIQNNTFGNGVNRAEINAMLPKIVEASKAAVLDARRRGGSYAGAF